ncbi:MAG TPA: NADP-dependent oxidoreductase [Chitinophagaceae bacterium]|nr:NADP-dependent oxidoreductase [Chitinophagaceae bacterium]
MEVIILENPGGVENLKLADMPIPVPKKDEVLIKVKAISINPVDIKTRTGKSLYDQLKNDPPIILGWDISGTVTETGSAVTQFKTGDEVFGMINFPGHGKAYAEYVAAPASELALKPANISHEEAAAATLAALTAWQALVTNAKVSKGQKVVIQAASGGVGHYAVQIAKYLGAYVIGTSSSANKDFVLNLGADEHIDYQKHKIDEVVNDADFVLDPIGDKNIDPSLNAVKKGGTVITLPSFFKELIAEKSKEKGVNGYYFSVQSNGEDMKKLSELLANGIIRSHVSRTFPLYKITEAHSQIESGRTVGKIVVTI